MNHIEGSLMFLYFMSFWFVPSCSLLAPFPLFSCSSLHLSLTIIPFFTLTFFSPVLECVLILILCHLLFLNWLNWHLLANWYPYFLSHDIGAPFLGLLNWQWFYSILLSCTWSFLLSILSILSPTQVHLCAFPYAKPSSGWDAPLLYYATS